MSRPKLEKLILRMSKYRIETLKITRLLNSKNIVMREQVTIRVIGKRAFGILAPPLRNRLLITVCASKYIFAFKRTVKTYLFHL